jgi:VPDSG-CTERM motif
LTDFDYTSVAGRMADDNLLQAAIWYLQGGQTYPGYPTPITSNKFYIDATNALGDSVLDAYTGTSVEVLQVWANPDDTGPAQNQLVLVPDGGLTVALLGGALVGLQVLRRKMFC